jgi:hypothetical protein
MRHKKKQGGDIPRALLLFIRRAASLSVYFRAIVRNFRRYPPLKKGDIFVRDWWRGLQVINL